MKPSLVKHCLCTSTSLGVKLANHRKHKGREGKGTNKMAQNVLGKIQVRIVCLFLDLYRCHLMTSVVGMIQDLGVEVEHVFQKIVLHCANLLNQI